MEIVVNEWLLDYLRPDAKVEEKDLAIKFINAWVKECDKIVIRNESPFTRKFYEYRGQAEQYAASRKHFRKLFDLLILNSDKTRILNDPEISEIPQNLAGKVPSDDEYLIELWQSVPSSIFVTTDAGLRDKLLEYGSSAKVYLLKEFLQTYLSGT